MDWLSDEYLQQLRDERARYQQQNPGDWRLAADPMSVQRIETALQMGQWQREGNLQAITQYEASQEALRSGGEKAPAWANLYLSDEYLQQLLDEMATYRAQYGKDWRRFVDPMVSRRIDDGIDMWYAQRTKPKEGGAKGEREYIQDEPMAKHLESALRQPEQSQSFNDFKPGKRLNPKPLTREQLLGAAYGRVIGATFGLNLELAANLGAWAGEIIFDNIRFSLEDIRDYYEHQTVGNKDPLVSASVRRSPEYADLYPLANEIADLSGPYACAPNLVVVGGSSPQTGKLSLQSVPTSPEGNNDNGVSSVSLVVVDGRLGYYNDQGDFVAIESLPNTGERNRETDIEARFGIIIDWGDEEIPEDVLLNYDQALRMEADFYARLVWGADNNATDEEKEWLFRFLTQGLTQGPRKIVRVNDPLELGDKALKPVPGKPGYYQAAWGLTVGTENTIYDIYGPQRYTKDEHGNFIPVPEDDEMYVSPRQQAMIVDNLLHEHVGHWLMYASGMGNFNRSPLMYMFDKVGSSAIEDALSNLPAGGLHPNPIGEGTRQNTDDSPQELLADLAMVMAWDDATLETLGIDRSLFEPYFRAAIRQAILYRTSPEEYYAELAKKLGWSETVPEPVEVNRADAPTRLFSTDAETYTPRAVYYDKTNAQGEPYEDWRPGILQRPVNAGYSVTAETVTVFGRTENAWPDAEYVWEGPGPDDYAWKGHHTEQYWLYIGWQGPDGYRYGWIRQDYLDISNIEELPIISIEDVNPHRNFDREDKFAPPRR